MDVVDTKLWCSDEALILASGSSTRALLLKNAGLDAEIIRPDVDERALESAAEGLSPAELASHLAKAKAENVSQRYPRRVTIGADQVLEIDGRVLHKPRDVSDARTHLRILQGRQHILHSAAAIACQADTVVIQRQARLTMRVLDEDAISTYIALAGENRVTSSVGGYQLEGLGIHLFDQVDGDHSTILGLPLIPVLAEFRARGLLGIS